MKMKFVHILFLFFWLNFQCLNSRWSSFLSHNQFGCYTFLLRVFLLKCIEKNIFFSSSLFFPLSLPFNKVIRRAHVFFLFTFFSSLRYFTLHSMILNTYALSNKLSFKRSAITNQTHTQFNAFKSFVPMKC